MTPTKGKGNHSPAARMTSQLALADMTRRVNHLEQTNAVIRKALEATTNALEAAINKQNDFGAILRAHILHVRELHNNPHFLSALVTKIDDLAAEAEQVAILKSEGKWAPPEYVAHATQETVPEGRLTLRITVTTRPSADGTEVETYPRVEQQNHDGSWFEALPFIRSYHDISDQRALSYLPSLEVGTCVFLEIIPGHFRSKDAELILKELDYVIGGEDGGDSEHYRVVLSSAQLEDSTPLEELSFALMREGADGYIRWKSYDLQDENISVPPALVEHFALIAVPFLNEGDCVFVGFYPL